MLLQLAAIQLLHHAADRHVAHLTKTESVL